MQHISVVLPQGDGSSRLIRLRPWAISTEKLCGAGHLQRNRQQVLAVYDCRRAI